MTSRAQQIKQQISQTEQQISRIGQTIRGIEGNVKGTQDYLGQLQKLRRGYEKQILDSIGGGSGVTKIREDKGDRRLWIHLSQGGYVPASGHEAQAAYAIKALDPAIGQTRETLKAYQTERSRYQTEQSTFQSRLQELRSSIGDIFTDPSNRRARGRAATILTGPRGAPTERTTIARQTLLGGSTRLG